jgi:GDPmannose 4,6-dehydratase
MKIGIITGITGQDGSYLAELLLEKNYLVYGLNRRTSTPNTSRIAHLLENPNFHLVEFDMTDTTSMIHVFKKVRKDYDVLEVYNLAAQSHVWTSFYQPEHSTVVDAIGPLKLLEVIRILELKNVRFYQASTSELYGKVQEIPQSETTPFYPRSPYAISKLYSFWITKNYRESYGMYTCNGILFNHESERRGHEFVTRKITLGVAKYLKTKSSVLEIGNLDAKRDWGYAPDYVEGMWRILQQDEPDDYVLATGETHTVREFIEKAFAIIGITIEWRGQEVNEKGYDKETGNLIVEVNPQFYRPAEVDLLIGNPSKAEDRLKWLRTVSFDEMIQRMVTYDCAQV